jgi:hypothetical protein
MIERKVNSRQRRRQLGYWLGCIAGLVVVASLAAPTNTLLHVPGPMNTGHAELDCDQCHREAPGSFRQQLQANARYLTGSGAAPVPIRHRPVENDDCLSCHDRPNDRHPVFRFFEPKYQRAREAIQPQLCVSCHREHSGQRVTIEYDYCQYCHDELDVRKDTLNIPHRELVAQGRWESCLGCHDFHGNHVMKLNTDVRELVPVSDILAYFESDPSPYSGEKKYRAAKERPDE